MVSPQCIYVQSQLLKHVSLFYKESAAAALRSKLVWKRYSDIRSAGPLEIVIPFDVPATLEPDDVYRITFSQTELTLWNRLPEPSSGNWQAIPNENKPIWYQSSGGGLTPAWNLFGNVWNLLTFQEEEMFPGRDKHGRFNAKHSPRFKRGLLEVPAVNETAALLVAGAIGLDREKVPLGEVSDYLKSPVLVLSHDCDNLRGNDFRTQLIRLIRFILPVLRFKLPKPGNLYWILRNTVCPKSYYYDNASGMIDLERMSSYTSTFYLLNGTYGRFGARSKMSMIPDLLKYLPRGWEVGIHYNYDTFLNEALFQSQLDELQTLFSKPITTGRAHYLRFDTRQSFPFLERFGIRVDESVGFSDFIGYRCGLAGCFQPYNQQKKMGYVICEIPMHVMDTTLKGQYPTNTVEKFIQLLSHIKQIGGAMSTVFHPGVFHNPEFPDMVGLYNRLLRAAYSMGAKAIPAGKLAQRFLKA